MNTLAVPLRELTSSIQKLHSQLPNCPIGLLRQQVLHSRRGGQDIEAQPS